MMMWKSDKKTSNERNGLWESEKQIRFVNPADNLILGIPMIPVTAILVGARDVILRFLEY